VHFMLSYIHIQGSLEAMNLHAQTLLCGTGNNFFSYMHFLNQWVTHTKLLNTQTKQIWRKTPKWYWCKQMLQSYRLHKNCHFLLRKYNAAFPASISPTLKNSHPYQYAHTQKINTSREGGSHIISIFQLYNTFRKSNVWQYKI